MNKNASLDKLCHELTMLPGLLDETVLSEEQSVILARVVKGVSSEKLRQACQKSDMKYWHVIPARDEDADWEEPLRVSDDKFVPVTPFREINGVITAGMFSHVLARELARLSRNGGSFSLLSAAVLNPESLEEQYGQKLVSCLEALLASVMMDHLETCDTIGLLRKGQFLCSLPGLGQLAARNLAEKIQFDFIAQSRPIFMQSNGQGASPAECAIGIVNLLQGECPPVKSLIKRSSAALEIAQLRNGTHIHQESAVTPLENTTLVQSSEKQFLFFGSNAP